MENCLFCKIITGVISSPRVHETPNAIVIRDIQPHAPVHLLVIPKQHVASLNDMSDADREAILPELFKTADEVALKEGFREKGYRTVFNNQSLAGQTVFHLHLHVLSGAPLSSGFGI